MENYKSEEILKVNKLVGLENTLELINQGVSKSELINRQTGKSTALALKYISLAISQPDKWIQIRDHIGTRASNRHLFAMTREIVYKLELKCIIFNECSNQIKFNLYEEWEETIIYKKC